MHDLEPEDLRALTLEASFVTGIPVVGTNLVFGRPDLWPQAQHNGHGDVVNHHQENGKHGKKRSEANK